MESNKKKFHESARRAIESRQQQQQQNLGNMDPSLMDPRARAKALRGTRNNMLRGWGVNESLIEDGDDDQ